MSLMLSRRCSSAALLLAWLMSACGLLPPPPGSTEAPANRHEETSGELVARNRDFAVVIALEGDTLASLARHYLGDARRAWWIADFNNVSQARAGLELVVPLRARNPIGVYPHGYQTIPVLCYHRFGGKYSKLAVTPTAFAAQLEYLARNNFRVITLTELASFLQGREALPRKSVVITIDDGYRSTYEIAYPLLKKYGFPATVFLYTDFVGAGDALSWPQMMEMQRSGLIEIQPHSKTHSDLALRLPQETDSLYRERIRKEVEVPGAVIEGQLASKVKNFAYPYGDTNESVANQLANSGLALGLTVTPGGNGFFSNPYMLRRTMVFGEDDIGTFAAKLTVFSNSASR